MPHQAIPHASTRSPRREEVNTHDPLLTVDQAAERLGTGVRFIRRLIQERRIRYVKLGKPVRIPESALTAYVAEHTVPTARDERARYRKAV
ncbi:excisionase [Streptomyces sp. SPB074]|nr:excisionase [Streptomyces sp. SPB074]